VRRSSRLARTIEVPSKRELADEVLKSGQGDQMPIGAVIIWVVAVVPNNWLELNGQSFSDVDYPILAALLGTTILPNFEEHVPLGMDDSVGWNLLDKWGFDSEDLTVGQLASHGHNVVGSGNHNHTTGFARPVNTTTGGTAGRVASGGTDINVGSSTEPNHDHSLDNNGSGFTHNNVQPSIAVKFIIKAR
jgi:microcystin-dependent protein